MLTKLVATATCVVLSAGGPAVAGAERIRPITASTLPIGARPHVVYETADGIHTPDGRVLTVPQATYGSGLVGRVGSRYVIRNTDQRGTYFTLLDEAGTSTPTGPALMSPSGLTVGGDHAVSFREVYRLEPTPVTLLDLGTGAVHEVDLKPGSRPNFLHVGANGATFSLHGPKGRVRQIRTDGTLRTLFTLKHRLPTYANPDNNLVISSARHAMGISSVRTPNRIRWSAKHQRATALSADASRLLVKGTTGAGNRTLQVRRVSDGKILGRFTFTTRVVPGFGLFESKDTFLAALRDRAGKGEQPYDVVYVRCRLGGACERLPREDKGYAIPVDDPLR